MSKRAPVEKLPLAVRKSLRDEWEAKKGDLETKLSTILGVGWTIEVVPNQIYAYAESSSYAQQNLGACLYEYFDGAIRRLQEYEQKFEEDGVNEINTIAHTHVMTLDVDEHKRFSYCGADVNDGQLRLLFAPECLGSNISYCLDRDVLLKALNDAPSQGGSTMSYAVRMDIRENYDLKIEAIQKRVGELVAKPDIKLNPNFEDNFAKLLEESKKKKTELRDDWEKNLGEFTRLYFEGLVSQLQWQKFEDDELLQEGFNEVIEKGEVVFRIVDKLQPGKSYNESIIENGVLYLQTIPTMFGTNVTDTADKLLDQL
ncbi:hypothetical protein F4808DRAFT_299435 [Astrocystis sublimbata]|nr:hypothetical protein F4808DRAFT_299435 [Astrocystis sublimbata]